MIGHSTSGRGGADAVHAAADVPRATDGPSVQGFPRNLYFGAEDWLAMQGTVSDTDLAHVRNQRHALVGHVSHKAEKLLAGLRALKDFDATGNAGSTLDHLEALRDDVSNLVANLVRDIEQAEDRYAPRFEPSPTTPAAVEPIPQAPAAAGPKPGPPPGLGLSAANRRDEILFGVRA